MKTPNQTAMLRESSETLRAIAHPLRLQIIELLHANKQLTVTEIHQQLGVEQAVASHHLRILKGKRVVDLERNGKNSLYFLANPAFYDIVRIISDNT
ncbi:MAG: metalloregulator ArsR/SmtB family transcription factor [Bacteroidota bacterium]